MLTLVKNLLMYGLKSPESQFSEKTAITYIVYDNHTKQEVEYTYTYSYLLWEVQRHAYAASKLPKGLHLIVKKTAPEAMFAWLGSMVTGNTPAMISHPGKSESPADYAKKIKHIVSLVKPAAVITDTALGPVIGLEGSTFSYGFVNLGSDQQYALYDTANFQESSFVQFSSGSTGLQKGVEITPEMLAAHIESYRKTLDLNTDSKVFSWLPLYHDMGLITSFLMPLSLGVPVVFMSPFYWISDPKLMLKAVTNHKCTHMWMPNFAFKLMADKVPAKGDMSSVKMIVNCSEPCYENHMQDFYNKFNPIGLKKEAITSCYAMAENVFAMSQGITEKFEPWTTPIEGVEFKLGPDNEVWVKSPFSMKSYFGKDPIVDADGFYPTGDLAEMKDGKLKINGRKKDLIITDGKNIFPNDLETIVNAVPGVHPGRSVALGVYNKFKGSEVVTILAEPDKWEDADKVQQDVRYAILKAFDISAAVHIVPTGWLRKTSSGKIARASNLEKLAKHNEYVETVCKYANNILLQSGKEMTATSNTKLISEGIMSSIDLMTLTLDLEADTGIGMGGAYSIYGQKNETPRDLAFFIESKVYGKPGV